MRLSLFLTLIVFLNPVYSETVYTQDIARLTLNGKYAKFTVSGEVPGNCAEFLLDTETTFGKNAYAMVLSAKQANKSLRRVDYDQPSGVGTSCNVTSIAIE